MNKKKFFICAVILLSILNNAEAQRGGRSRGGFGGFGGGMTGGPGRRTNQGTNLIEIYDENGDGWLNTQERNTARQSSGQQIGRMSSSRTSGIKLSPEDVKWYSEDVPLYDISTLRTIFLEFENNDWEAELDFFYHTGVEVPATMIVDGKTFHNVGVRFRGNTSYSSSPSGYKKPLNLSIDFLEDKQYLYGYRTLNLNINHGDPTFMKQVLFSYIARQYFPALKANYIRVVINGENWGIYINYQQFNTDFIDENFGTRKGARWKAPVSMGRSGASGLSYVGDNPELYKSAYEIKSKDDPNSWADLANLCKVLNRTPTSQLEAALEPILDIDGALKFLAVEKTLTNSDGYYERASDFIIYQDIDGRFHIFPYDTSETMSGGGRGGRGGFGGGGGSTNLDPMDGAYDSGKPLLSRLLAVPELRQRYLGYIRDIAENWLDWNKIEPFLQQNYELIADDINRDTKKTTSTAAFLSGIGLSEQQTTSSSFYSRNTSSTIKSFIQQRRAYLLSLSEVSQAPLP